MIINNLITVENLSKVYKLYNAPIDRMKEALHPRKKSYHKEFYALNDVSFEIKRGECVGILGKNGAGKSTILKIITGVLTPTSGKVTVNGRISALLELGAGFNPEYTGMENIYFQGNLMGFEREEMEAKVQAILDFAEIGAFIDQPVKNYSSGMFARLAFAVAISVEPDILIVDEALSVGDAAFQNKCMRRMIKIMEEGATVLFVSHDTQAINKFCTKAIWLKDGTKHMEGETEDVTNAYMSFSAYGLETTFIEKKVIDASDTENKEVCHFMDERLEFKSIFGTGDVEFLFAGFYDEDNNKITTLRHGAKVSFRCLVYVMNRDIFDLAGGITLIDRLNNVVMTINSYMYQNPLKIAKKGTRFSFEFQFIVPKITPSEYVVDIAMAEGTQINHTQLCWVNAGLTISIISDDFIDCGGFYTIPKSEVAVKYNLF